MESVYIETSVISHASARPSSDPAVAVLQQQARDWFAIEASIGDPDAASRRLALLADVSLLIPDAKVEEIADQIISRSLMPANARLDALHVASAATARVEYLFDTKLQAYCQRPCVAKGIRFLG
jgi:hypothetical protein